MSSPIENVEIEESDDDDIPDVQICDKLCKDFASITNTDEACAQFYLQDRKWDLERSVNDFFEDRLGGSKVKELKGTDGNEVEVVLVVDGSQESIAAAATAVLRNSSLRSQDKPTTSTAKSLGNTTSSNTNDVAAEFPEVFKFITWNIDGLDDKNLQIRTKAVTDYVKEVKADVIFFQEVIPKSEEYLRSNLKNYKFLFGGDREYYTGLAYNPNTVQYQLHSVEDFPDSMMGRNLLLFKANIGGSEVLFMNSHLESGGTHSGERKNQLRFAYQKMTECSSDLNVILAGDLNLRDKEVSEVGGIPSGVRDAWISCGERKECAYTWDMTRNDNTIINGKFKPRMRFDRIYYKSANKSPIKATFFGLIGLSRLTPYTTFPSDHWGLLCFFSLDGKSVKK